MVSALSADPAYAAYDWNDDKGEGDLLTIDRSRASCLDILNRDESTGSGNYSGNYTIDIAGDGSQPAITVYCDMTTDGGGYTYYPTTSTGISTTRFDQANSCTALGLELMFLALRLTTKRCLRSTVPPTSPPSRASTGPKPALITRVAP